jgi:hypothetical protein
MRRITRTVWATFLALALTITVGGAASAQDETIYETQFLDAEQSATEWEFPPGVTAVTDDGYTAAFTPGALTVTLNGAPNAWLDPDLPGLPRDQAVEARIGSSTGDESALFGVACRADLPKTGYAFLVGIDGYYAIGKYGGGEAKAIVNAKGTKRTDAVDPLGSNIVRGECVGKKQVTLTLFVNGEEVASIVDKKPPKKFGKRALVVTEVAEGEQATTEFTGFAVHAL